MKKISLIFLLCEIGSQAIAQNLVTNSGETITMTDGVSMTVQGDLLNSGTILNEGGLRLSGNWSNDGDYHSVSGTFTLSGANQIFDPGASTYGNLSINSTGIAIINDLIISNSLDLVNGIVSLTPDTKILLLENAIINGGNENSYIEGALFATTSGDFTFPIGTESEYLPVSLSNIQASDSVGVKAYSSPLTASISSGLDAISQNRHWEVIGGASFMAESIRLPLSGQNFIDNAEEATIGFTNDLENPLSIIGTPAIDGSLESGFISTSASILPGYYVLGKESLVAPPITVINVVTSLQDGKHDFLRIENIESYKNNLVEIFDRQGVKIFEMQGYNNTDRVFRGSSNVGSRGVLQTGSYYYTVKLTESKREAGFIYVKN
ncbi:MAG: gliding motility-associated C-terminal domain-containing protein [Ekhidna sp.]